MNGYIAFCMQTYYRCEEGFEARAEQVTTKACKKLITDMHHEVTYYGSKLALVENRPLILG